MISSIKLENLETPHTIISQLVTELNGKNYLPTYNDCQTIDHWIQAAKDFDTLLLILAEELPSYFEKKLAQNKKVSLGGIKKKVLKKLSGNI